MTVKLVSSTSISTLKSKLLDELKLGFVPIKGAYSVHSSINVMVGDECEDKKMNTSMIDNVSFDVINSLFVSIDKLSLLQSEGFRVMYVCSYNNDILAMFYKPSIKLIEIEELESRKKSGWAIVRYEEIDSPE